MDLTVSPTPHQLKKRKRSAIEHMSSPRPKLANNRIFSYHVGEEFSSLRRTAPEHTNLHFTGDTYRVDFRQLCNGGRGKG